MRKYRIKEIQYTTNVSEFYPEYSEESEIEKQWKICDDVPIGGYPIKDMCLQAIEWDKTKLTSKINKIIIHEI